MPDARPDLDVVDPLRVPTEPPVAPQVDSPSAPADRPEDASSASGKSAAYRPELDGIRAIAVAMVIAFHLGFDWMRGGFIGVDVFFVLSGFLITNLLLREMQGKGRVGFTRFYARRARRLLPAAAVTLAAVVAAGRTLLPLGDRWSLWQDAKAAALYVANWHLIGDNREYFAPGKIPGPIEHWWSLAVEEQFYFVWPLLLAVLWWVLIRRLHLHRGALIAAVGTLLATSVALSFWFTSPAGSVRYYATYTRAYQLLAGALIAIVLSGRRAESSRAGARPLGAWLGVGSLAALVGLAALSIKGAAGYPGPAGVAVTAASAGLLVSLAAFPAGVMHRALGVAPMAAAGRLSYSLYLWHWPVIVLFPIAAARLGVGWGKNPFILVGLTTACAFASYSLVERPIRFRVWRRAPSIAIIATGLAVSVLLAMASGPVLIAGDTFTQKALAAARDLPSSAPCPYEDKEFPPPEESPGCLYRKGSTLTVALLGDSHGQQYLPTVISLAERFDWSLVLATRTACGFDDSVGAAHDENGNRVKKEACVEWRDAAYPRLIQRFDPDVVLLGTRSYFVGMWNGSRVVERRDGALHRRLWAAGVERSVRTLTAGGARAIVFAGLPTAPFEVPDCLTKHPDDFKACDYSVEKDPIPRPYNDLLRRMDARIDAMDVVSLEQFVCPDGTCPAVLNEEVVHRDDDHLTATFAEGLAPELERALRAAGVDPAAS